MTSLDAAFVSDVVTNMVVLRLGTQTSCHTTARRLQSSRTTAGTLAGTFDDEIDLAGSEGWEKMKVANINP